MNDAVRKILNQRSTTALAAALTAVCAAWPARLSAEPLTLQDAINRAMQASEKVGASQADLDAQVAGRRSAWASVGPRVNAEYNQLEFEKEQRINFGGRDIVMRGKEAKTASITVAQPITGLYALIENGRLNGLQVDLAEAGLVAARADVGFSAAETFLRAVQAERLLRVSQASVEAAEKQVNDAMALERVGRIGRGDVLKIQLALSQAKANEARARATRTVAMTTLKTALDAPPDADLSLTEELPQIAVQVSSVDDAYKKALNDRAEVRQARLGAEVASFGTKLAYAQFLPSVNAFAKWDHNLGEVTGLGSQDKTTRTFGIQATWEIWNNGSRVFEVSKAVSLTKKAELQALQAEEGIKLEIASVMAGLAASQESLQLAEAQVAQAEEAYRIEQARFRAGSASATDLVLAEASRAGAQGGLVTAQTDLVVNQLKLQRALGYEQPKL